MPVVARLRREWHPVTAPAVTGIPLPGRCPVRLPIRALLLVLVGLLCTLPVSLLQGSFVLMPPRVGLVWELLVTLAAGALWYRWQRDAWVGSVPRVPQSCRVVLTTALCCAATSAAYHYWIAEQPAPGFAHVDLRSPWSQATILVAALFTAPLLEEAVFRGFVLGMLRKRHGATVSVVLSGVAFGVAHGDLSRIVPQVLGGILLGAIVVCTRRLWLALAAHGAMNLAGLLEGAAYRFPISERLGILFPVLCAVVAGVAALDLRRTLTRTCWSPPR